jgi:hypothetical protein
VLAFLGQEVLLRPTLSLTFGIFDANITPISQVTAEVVILSNRNPYTISGLGLLTAGILFCAGGLFIFQITWLTAFGICLFILAFILISLGEAVPRLPPEICVLLLETGMENITTLIEELGIKSRAIYLPSSLSPDYPRAFLPLDSNGSSPRITRALPKRMLARYGAGPEDIGLLIGTIGSAAVTLLETRPGANAPELESALTSLFSGRLGVADGTRVTNSNGIIRVEIDRPRLENGSTWSHRCLGSPLATIAATVAAEAWNKPITIAREEVRDRKCCIELEVGE